MTFLTLGYHIVNRAIDDTIAISEALFEAHLRYFRDEGYVTLSLEQAIADINGEKPAPPHSLLLTFDDGYEDNARTVLPLLLAYGMRATEFVITACIGQSNRWNPRAGYDTSHMTWDDLRAWKESGCDIGGHSHLHLCMTRLSRDELEATLQVNKDILEERLGVRLRAFAYPYGKYNQAVQDAIHRHYDMAFSVKDGTWDAQFDRYAINRLNISPAWNVEHLAQHINEREAFTRPSP
jgi:peptidoglycan/xylan/chitin deacetylase (PgdA/CDA1 family)